ncbi:MAG TPA: DUF4965 domain-containing protein [Armatimonadota bacterium]
MALLLPALGVAAALFCGSALSAEPADPNLRPPSVPLIACDPYFSVWSGADRLTDTETVHWTGKPHPLHSLIKIDGSAFRLMGAQPAAVPAMPQTSVEVLPTRTIYTFADDRLTVTLTFTTPALPEDLDVLSRPVTYVTWKAQSRDGKPHTVSLYLDASSALAVNTMDQPVICTVQTVGPVTAAIAGSTAQPILAKRGDDLRIDWGYLYVAPLDLATRPSTGLFQTQVGAFIGTQVEAPRSLATVGPVLSVSWDLGKVGGRAVSRTALIAYDDLYSIQYFKQNLRPYWRRNGAEASDLLAAAISEFKGLQRRCASFDSKLMGDLTRAGGKEYARICSLAYRQCLAANKLAADSQGKPLLFPKENFSNGCIATVDIIYPMAPLFLLLSPALTKASLVPVLDYAASEHWKWPFAPHDLGTYPQANGQVYGGGERTEENQMPVEESGNMLLVIAAIAKVEGNARFAEQYWPTLTKWAEYLKSKGLDPENQLCTDDFAGHLAHNVNLSAKAITALGAYALLCQMKGDQSQADEYRKLAKQYAATWAEKALDGDHYRLAFDRPGTWSQKYNLVWDTILGMDLFPKEVMQREMAFYLGHLNTDGLPLDNRQPYTKLDWTIWTASLAATPREFQALVSPVWKFLNESVTRTPMTDWYETKEPRQHGFQARAVVGGVFIKALYNSRLWGKWASKAPVVEAGTWAPLPKRPTVRIVVPTSQRNAQTWRYGFEQPAKDWMGLGFDDSGWKQGPGGFGTPETPSSVVRTRWDSSDIWLRRTFALPDKLPEGLCLYIHHDEDAEVYLNGVPALQVPGFISEYEAVPLSQAALAALKPGADNLIAVHCRQTGGGQYIDVGLCTVSR